METRKLIDIPNHPKLTGITRKAQIRKTDNHYENGSVEMVINIFSYLDGVELKDMFRQIIMVASNEEMINSQTFEVLEKDEEGNYPTEAVPEYDFLFSLVKNNVKTIFELEEMYVTLRADLINKKLYN